MRKRITRLALAAAMCTTLVTGNVYASAKVVKVNTDAADTLQEEVDSVTGPAFGVDSDQYDEKIAEAEEAARRQAEEAQREKEEAVRQEILEREEAARQEALAREEAARQEAQAQEEALVAQEDEEIAALRASMKGKSLGTFKTYAYSLDCDPSGITAAGTVPAVGRTIAADWSVLPKGTKVRIGNSDTIYTVEDKGSNIKGQTIDIFMRNDRETRNHGVRYQEVYVITGEEDQAQARIDAILAARAQRQAARQ